MDAVSDMLVRLYDLDAHPDPRAGLSSDVVIRPALPPEKRRVCTWIATEFSEGWASECEVAFARVPMACTLAIHDGALAGFACHDVTARGFFGPTGVGVAHRGLGIGSALLSASLRALRDLGYAYAVIGDAGPLEFYRKTVGAIEIPGSAPGIYRGMLRKPKPGPAA